MTATEAVKMQLEAILAAKGEALFAKGQEEAAQATKIFGGLADDDDFRMFALAHAQLIMVDPVRVAISLLYHGYMAAKLEMANVNQGQAN